MKIQEMWKQENDSVTERYDLSIDRISLIKEETTVAEPFRDYFGRLADFAELIDELLRLQMREELEALSIEELKAWNHRLYEDILPEQYENSYGNPAYAVKTLGSDFGRLLSFFYAQFRSGIVFAYECRQTEITILLETLIGIYNMFEHELPELASVKDALYWFVSDYTDVTVLYRTRESLDPELTFAKDIVTQSELTDLRYLYRFGDYISESELAMAVFMNSLPEKTVEQMAATFTEGYRKGFEVMGRDLSKKRTVVIRYELGMERMVRQAIANFRAIGLEPILYRAALWSVNQNPGRRVGFYGSSANMQYDYDHRYDSALYSDKAFKDRKLAVLKVAYETCKKEAADYAGPAVIETFGRPGFDPVNKPEAFALDDKQQKLGIAYSNEAMQIINQYMPGDETSFTIIAFPVPAIGPDFEEIFRETIRINTLDYDLYQAIQQKLIDALDQADHVIITGRNGNRTELTVKLHQLENPERDSNFENCVADVNIPLGEVFTSPVLNGTTGTLHVSSVYIGSIQYKNLMMGFADGMITDYSCENFDGSDGVAQGKALIKQQILKNHETLPMGEFAIGTNTTAYQMARRFGIIEKLPILIVEKMGPHFAVGDTCYSWSEDTPVYNPDGKEIVARDNEVSILRKEDVSKAYFACHTDITIPYSELGDIIAVKAGGSVLPLIKNGRFVLPGTEELNKALD